MMYEIIRSYTEGLLARDGILIAMKKSIEKGNFYPELLPKPVTAKELEEVISETNNTLTRQKLLNNEKRKEVLLGSVMNKVRMCVEGKVVAEKLK
jgi:Glu-tRNA(Gln) amidotransferase subunit E-like FAD-binding protein